MTQQHERSNLAAHDKLQNDSQKMFMEIDQFDDCPRLQFAGVFRAVMRARTEDNYDQWNIVCSSKTHGSRPV